MRGEAGISGIYRLGEPSADIDPLETWGRMERLRRAAWRTAGVVSVVPVQLPEPLATELRKWAEDEYGKR